MKEIRFLASCDATFAETGERTDADTTICIAIGPDPEHLRVYELDLTRAYADKLRAEIGTWTQIAHTPGEVISGLTGPARRNPASRGQDPATREYYRQMRSWADKNMPGKYHQLEKGGWYYSPGLRRAFAEFWNGNVLPGHDPHEEEDQS